MKFLQFNNLRFGFTLGLLIIGVSELQAAFVVELGSTTVDLSAGTGTVNTTIDIVMRNESAAPAALSGYSLFFDLHPARAALPNGVRFADPPATYLSGGGIAPLSGASPGTQNLNPAAGDLGLGQFQFFDAIFQPGEAFTAVQVNLAIDLNQAEPGTHDVSLANQGENTLVAISEEPTFRTSVGTLTLLSQLAVSGDFDNDGDVDGSDFLHWQRGESPNPLSAADLASWQANFNSSPQSALTAVPEPTSLALLLIGSYLFIQPRRSSLLE